MRTFNERVTTAVVLDHSSNSAAVPLKNIFMYSIAAVITGTPTGTLVIQVSNDPETNDTQPSTNAPVNWATLADTSTNVVAAGITFWNMTDVAYNYVRVAYTDSSSGASTATMNIIFNGKGM